jgi:hypothetical protein
MQPSRMSDKAPAFLWIGIALISAVLAGFFVVLRGLPIPIGDQWWDPVHVAVLTRQGQLSAHDLFAYSEGHRLVNIRIITWLMTILTDYNPILMNSATWVFSAINVLLAYRLLCNQRVFSHRLPRNYRLAGLALFSATLFSSLTVRPGLIFTFHNGNSPPSLSCWQERSSRPGLVRGRAFSLFFPWLLWPRSVVDLGLAVGSPSP